MLASAVHAQDLATEIRSVIDEYENAVRANTLKIINAPTEEEKNKYRQTIPSAAPCAAARISTSRCSAMRCCPNGSRCGCDPTCCVHN